MGDGLVTDGNMILGDRERRGIGDDASQKVGVESSPSFEYI
jgi:hypothetical protein